MMGPRIIENYVHYVFVFEFNYVGFIYLFLKSVANISILLKNLFQPFKQFLSFKVNRQYSSIRVN
jgi:hypothetical protein